MLSIPETFLNLLICQGGSFELCSARTFANIPCMKFDLNREASRHNPVFPCSVEKTESLKTSIAPHIYLTSCVICAFCSKLWTTANFSWRLFSLHDAAWQGSSRPGLHGYAGRWQLVLTKDGVFRSKS